MPENLQKLMDETGWQLLEELQQDARLSYAELARRVGLSVPSVVERLRKLEDAGVIEGYHAKVNLKALGLPLLAVVRLSAQGRQLKQVAQLVQKMPEVQQCYRVTGDACFLLMLAATDMQHLEQLLDRLGLYGQTNTSLVVAQVVQQAVVTPQVWP